MFWILKTHFYKRQDTDPDSKPSSTKMKSLFVICILLCCGLQTTAQWKPFRFAFISDTHIGSPNGNAEEDLRRTVKDINNMDDISFVVITGDITELGTNDEIILAKQILDGLDVPWYIIPGNHDSGWSESGGMSFTKTFGSDRFYFSHNDIVFMGCASGPYVRMSDGHIPRDAVLWMDSVLKKTDPKTPIVFLNHYPLDKDLDNWYEAIDRLKQHNIIAALCGHGHSNRKLNFEDIPAVMGRSNLRGKSAYGGYNIVDIRRDSMIFSERMPGFQTNPAWTGIKLESKIYDLGRQFPRPSYKMNDSFPNVRLKWSFASDANVISTPMVVDGLVVFGNSLGRIDALDLKNGKKKWSFQTDGAIYSSPATDNGFVVFGSCDGNIYCLKSKTGKLAWKLTTDAAVLGSPIMQNGVVYIGGSDHVFRAVKLSDGKEIWRFAGLNGPVVSTPVIHGGKIIFGAWDRHLYALDIRNGSLQWKWNNGSSVRNYSPASCIPVVKDDVVYIVAPDRYLSAIDIHSGSTLWRTNESTVRESIGISADGELIYAKTMNDTIVAFPTSRNQQKARWKMHAGFGYEHVPSMLIESNGVIHFGTKNGVVYAIDAATQKVVWKYKVDNSMVNTVNLLKSDELLASTMDGKLALLESIK